MTPVYYLEVFAAAAFTGSATALCLRREYGRGWGLSVAVGVFVFLCFGVLLFPVETHAVKLDMPR